MFFLPSFEVRERMLRTNSQTRLRTPEHEREPTPRKSTQLTSDPSHSVSSLASQPTSRPSQFNTNRPFIRDDGDDEASGWDRMCSSAFWDQDRKEACSAHRTKLDLDRSTIQGRWKETRGGTMREGPAENNQGNHYEKHKLRNPSTPKEPVETNTK